ncbi:hypothetical protein C8R43DRAFT_1061225 [Mycena crocata]|nr:hypothetical protein C8R43DRAFT_1061225 [Mycena crocata]
MDAISSALLLGQSATSGFERQAKSLIRASEENVARIDSQIRDLVRLRERERGFITALKLVIAPIRKLPAELLVQIFLDAVNPPYYSRQVHKRVLVICQVCAHWRELACTTPQLWTWTLPNKNKKTTPEVYIALAKIFLERSAPLSIPVSFNPDAAPLEDAIFGVASRWKTLSWQNTGVSRLRRLPMDTLQALEEVDFRIYNQDPTPPIKAFLGAPRLRKVALAVRHTVLFPMPWSQLTHLTVSEKSPQLCLDILLQCTNIVTASFTDMNSWIDEPASRPLVTLPWLESLDARFGMSPGYHLISFFAPLNLPVLKKLSIHADLDDEWSSAVFTAFQRRCPNLEDLMLHSCSLDAEDLIAVLRNAPNLVDLDLDFCMHCVDDSVLELLQYSAQQTTHLVPRLRQFSASFAGGNFQETVFKEMILSRWWSDAQLRALPVPPLVARWEVIHVWRGEDDDHEEISASFKATMKRLQAEGLLVSFT